MLLARNERPFPVRAAGVLLVGFLFLGLASGCESDSRTDSAEAETNGGVYAFGPPLPASASLKEILEHPDALQRAKRISIFLENARAEDVEDIKDEFEVAALERGDLEYALFANWWARFDPKMAFVYADNSLRAERPRVVLEVVRTWGRMDPMGLLESHYLDDIYSKMPAVRPELVDSLIVGWFESGRDEELLEWILDLGAGSAQAAAFSTYVRMRVLRDGAAETLEWAFHVPYHADIRRGLVAATIAIACHQEPELAIAAMDRAEKLGIDVATFMPRIANGWSHHDPAAAMTWVTQFPDSQERARAIQRVVKRWLRRDEPAVFEWLETVKGQAWADPPRYMAIRKHVENANFKVDWEAMMSLADEMVTPQRRVALYGWLAERWYVVDEAAAEAWISANESRIGEAAATRARTVKNNVRAEVNEAMANASRVKFAPNH